MSVVVQSTMAVWDGHGGESHGVMEIDGAWVAWRRERWPAEGVQWTHVYSACPLAELPPVPKMIASMRVRDAGAE